MPVLLVVVKTVTDNKFVLDIEAVPVGSNVVLAAFGLVQKSNYFDG